MSEFPTVRNGSQPYWGKLKVRGKGWALQATRPIPSNQLIYKEEALVSFPSIPTDMLAKTFLSDQLIGGKMKNGQHILLKTLKDQPPAVTKKLMGLYGEPIDVDDSDEDPDEEKKHTGRMLVAKVAKNAFTHVEDVDGVLHSFTRVFHALSYVNHSCRPNAVIEWHPKMQKATLQSLIEIPESAEIEIDYLGTVEDTLIEGKLRREKLLKTYGFECTCPACGPAGDKNEKDNDLRLKAWSHYEDIDFDVTLPLKDNEMTTAREDRRKAQIGSLDNYIAALCELQLRDGKLLEAYVARAKYYEQGYQMATKREKQKQGKRKTKVVLSPKEPCYYLGQALDCWELAEVAAFCVYGEDHPQLLWIGKRLQAIRAEAMATKVDWKARE